MHIIQVCLSWESSSANNAFERLLSFMNWCHMATHLPFLCKTCIANITIERLFLHELILVQEADKKFEPFNDHNAIGVKFWSFMFLCYMLVQSWKPSVLNKNWSFFKRLMIKKTFCFISKTEGFPELKEIQMRTFCFQK